MAFRIGLVLLPTGDRRFVGIHLGHYQGHNPDELLRSRIAVVGAGACGLSTAHALREVGYENVTVLERQGRVGGKCHTVWHEGRSYEMGAAVLTRFYKTVRSLMQEFGVNPETRRCPAIYVDADEGGVASRPPSMRAGKWLKLGPEGARFAALLARHRRIYRAGFDGIDPDLHRPFGDWARRHRVETIAGVIEQRFTAFGYGFTDQVPAAYVLKFITKTGRTIGVGGEGYGGLWDRVAQGLDVKLGVDIERVDRSSSGVKVRTSSAELDFDAIILTCPLDRALDFLDDSECERELITPIRYNPYFAVGVIVDGVSRTCGLFLPDNLTPDKVGEPMFAYRRYGDTDLVVFYSYGRDIEDENRVVDRIRSTVEKLGGRVLEVHSVERWSYFPHVLQHELDEGYYRKFEGLQGENRTWYAGEILAFSDVEATAHYGRHLVERFFSNR